MKLPVIKRLDKQDLIGKGEIPGWVDPFLQVLNGFIEPVTRALQGKLTFADNFYGAQISIQITHNTDQEINPHIKTKPIGCFILSTNGNKYTAFNWGLKQNGNIFVNVEFKDTMAKNVPCVFYVFGG